MPQLNMALSAWETPQFNEVLKNEIRQLGTAALPLQQGLSRSSYVSGDKFDVIVLSTVEEPGIIRVKTGIFYQGVIAGCSCADDPTPVGEQTEYCVVQFEIDKQSAEAKVTLLEE